MSLADVLKQVDPLSVTGRAARAVELAIEGFDAALDSRGQYVAS